MVKLPEVFNVESFKSDADDIGYRVTLQPQLADYVGIIEYDGAGNANLTIVRKSDKVTILDTSLDSGEINQLDTDYFA